MGHKFNGGVGADVCDGCGTMLVDGDRVLSAHRRMDVNGFPEGEPCRISGPRHYCRGECMLLDARQDRGMHRALTILLAQESKRIRILEAYKPHAATDVGGSPPAIADAARTIVEVERRCASQEVRP